jgi:hypothetical protein
VKSGYRQVGLLGSWVSSQVNARHDAVGKRQQPRQIQDLAFGRMTFCVVGRERQPQSDDNDNDNSNGNGNGRVVVG